VNPAAAQSSASTNRFAGADDFTSSFLVTEVGGDADLEYDLLGERVRVGVREYEVLEVGVREYEVLGVGVRESEMLGVTLGVGVQDGTRSQSTVPDGHMFSTLSKHTSSK
jgi:hypothetical protein